MRWLVTFSGVFLLTGAVVMAQPVDALRFEGSWNLSGANSPHARLEFQVDNDGAFMATYFHPHPSVLSDVHIQGDSFSAWYLDDYGSRVNLTAQLQGNQLVLALAPDGRPPLLLSGARVAPDPTRPPTQHASGDFTKSGNTAGGQFSAFGHTYVFSGGKDGSCFSFAVGRDGKGVSFNGCAAATVNNK